MSESERVLQLLVIGDDKPVQQLVQSLLQGGCFEITVGNARDAGDPRYAAVFVSMMDSAEAEAVVEEISRDFSQVLDRLILMSPIVSSDGVAHFAQSWKGSHAMSHAMLFTIEKVTLTDQLGRPVVEGDRIARHLIEAENAEDAIVHFIQADHAALIGQIVKFPGLHAVATAKKDNAVYTLQALPASGALRRPTDL